jgi:TPR repeat protein
MRVYCKNMQDIDLIRESAEKGDAESQYKLAVIYFNGEEIAQDYDLAVVWFSRAAEQGHTDAHNGLGVCYYRGFGVTKDYAQAVHYYRLAVDRGHPWALCNLGVLYANGEGVTKDEIEAYAYYNIAGINLEAGRTNRSNLEKTLSRDEIAAGQRRTKELQKEIDAKIAAKAAGK